jgi:hypothetical protein
VVLHLHSTILLEWTYGVRKHIGTGGFPLAFKAPYSHSLSNASFEPGGWLEDPVLSTSLLLDLTIRPRMNIYIASDDYASFIIDARISYIHGEPFYNTSYDIKPTSLAPSPLSSST